MPRKPLNIKDPGTETWCSVREWAGHLLIDLESLCKNRLSPQAHYIHRRLLPGFGNVL